MVKDYAEHKENDRKRQMTQEKWYNLNAEQYGLQIRKKRAVMMRPSANFVSPQGDGQSPVCSKKEEAEEEEEDEEEEEGEEADRKGAEEEEEEKDDDKEEPIVGEEGELYEEKELYDNGLPF